MLLSIIIPTKNRYTTLFSVVDMILSFNLNEDLEIVIQDNSDINSEALNFMLDRKNYNNLKYFHCKEKLSVIENSDKAVLNSNGDYVCFIGDDDGVMPNIVEITKWMKKNDYKALKSYKPNYYWPNQQSNYLSKNISGVLKFKETKTKSFKIISTRKALIATLKIGGVSMEMLPCLYHGIISREVLQSIYQKANTFFPGPSPDMANAIALTQIIDSYVYVNYPVVISGKSTQSTGGAGVLHKHVSRIEDVSHLPKDTSANWDKRIPKYWTGPTIWAESLIKTLEVFQNYQLLKTFNFIYLYSYLEVFQKNHKDIIFKEFKINRSVKFYNFKTRIFLYRVKSFIFNRIGKFKRISGVADIKVAVKILQESDNVLK